MIALWPWNLSLPLSLIANRVAANIIYIILHSFIIIKCRSLKSHLISRVSHVCGFDAHIFKVKGKVLYQDSVIRSNQTLWKLIKHSRHLTESNDQLKTTWHESVAQLIYFLVRNMFTQSERKGTLSNIKTDYKAVVRKVFLPKDARSQRKRNLDPIFTI